MLTPHSVLFLFIQMHHDEMGVRSDSLTFQFIYAKRRPSFLLKLILVEMINYGTGPPIITFAHVSKLV